MADTKHHLPVEGDGISYSGIIWFIVVLTVVTVVCQALMDALHRTPVAAITGQRHWLP